MIPQAKDSHGSVSSKRLPHSALPFEEIVWNLEQTGRKEPRNEKLR